MNSLSVDSKIAGFYSGQGLPSFKEVASSVATEVGFLAQEAMEYTADVLFDIGRGFSYAGEWVSDYSNFSPEVKDSASRVKSAAERFNLFASFCETYTSGKALVTKQMETAAEAAISIASYVGASFDFAGRLDELEIVSLGRMKPYVGGVGSLADATLGLNGIKEVLQDPEFGKSKIGTLLKLAKHTALVALATLAGIASYFTTFASGYARMPLYLLTLATTFLTLKVANIFYDKLTLSPPLESAIQV